MENYLVNIQSKSIVSEFSTSTKSIFIVIYRTFKSKQAFTA